MLYRLLLWVKHRIARETTPIFFLLYQTHAEHTLLQNRTKKSAVWTFCLRLFNGVETQIRTQDKKDFCRTSAQLLRRSLRSLSSLPFTILSSCSWVVTGSFKSISFLSTGSVRSDVCEWHYPCHEVNTALPQRLRVWNMKKPLFSGLNQQNWV